MNVSKSQETKKSNNINRVYQVPDLIGHKIVDMWAQGDHELVILSKQTNEDCEQIYYTRFTF